MERVLGEIGMIILSFRLLVVVVRLECISVKILNLKPPCCKALAVYNLGPAYRQTYL